MGRGRFSKGGGLRVYSYLVFYFSEIHCKRFFFKEINSRFCSISYKPTSDQLLQQPSVETDSVFYFVLPFHFPRTMYSEAWQIVESLQSYTVYLDIYIEFKIVFYLLLCFAPSNIITFDRIATDKQSSVLMICVINVPKPPLFEYCDGVFT